MPLGSDPPPPLIHPALSAEFSSSLAAVVADAVSSSPRSGSAASDAAAAALLPPLRVACAQIHATAAGVAANVARIGRILHALRGEDGVGSLADLLVLPETFLQGYHVGPTLLRASAVVVPSPAELQQPSTGDDSSCDGTHENPLVAVSRLAEQYGVAIVLPFAERGTAPDPADPAGAASPAPIYNSVAVFDVDGRLARLYRKSHLWGAHYEKRVFTPGPGVGADPAASFLPFTLARFPHIPLGVLICFDVEFPEPCRLLAMRGAKCIVTVLASGDDGGFTSRKVVPTRACENDAAVVFVNYPSSTVPELRGASKHAVAPDAESVAYAGGSTVCGPDGSVCLSLPAFVCAPHKASPFEWAGVVTGGGYDEEASGEVMRRLAGEGACAPAFDEAVFIVGVDPSAPRYAAYRARCPYLRDARVDLYGAEAVAAVAESRL